MKFSIRIRLRRRKNDRSTARKQNTMMSFLKKHKKISIVTVLILAALGYWFFLRPSDTGQTVTVYNYGAAEVGTVTQSVSGTGQISPAQESDLKARTGGTVLEINVGVGQSVKSGDVIARIDDSDARADVEDARMALESAQLSLEELNEPCDELSLMQAQNALDKAEESLVDDRENLTKTYKDGFDAVVDAFGDLPSVMSGLQSIVTGASDYVTQTNSSYIGYYSDAIKSYDAQAPELAANAATAYREAESRYDANFQNYKLMDRDLVTEEEIKELINETYQVSRSIAEALKNTNILIQRYKDVLTDKNLAPETFADAHLTSLTSYSSKNGSHVAALFSALQSIADAKKAISDDEYAVEEKTKTLENLIEPVDEIDLKSAQLAVTQKERSLAEALEIVEDCVITAPFDGIIASIDIEEDEEISAQAGVATIITENQVATVTLNEIDIAKIEIGQKASVTFSAIDDLTMTGKVIEVSELGSVSQGVVSYDVVIALDAVNKQIKSGMSVSTVIITDIRQNVIIVPLTALKSGADGSYVLVPDGDSVKQQTVNAGLSDDDYIEITEGLSEGDQIVISSSKQTAKSSSTTSGSSGGSLFNIGGMGGRMR